MHHNNLPTEIRAEIMHYLRQQNFTAAKQIYDQWVKKQSQTQKESSSSDPTQ